MEANGETERGRPPRDMELKEMGGLTPGERVEGIHPAACGWPPLPASQLLLGPQTSALHPPQPFPSSSSPTRPQAPGPPSHSVLPAPRPSGWGDISLGPHISREPGSQFWMLQAWQRRGPGLTKQWINIAH